MQIIPVRLRRPRALWPAVLAVITGLALVDSAVALGAESATTAWRHGAFQLDPGGAVSRSRIVVGPPNLPGTASTRARVAIAKDELISDLRPPPIDKSDMAAKSEISRLLRSQETGWTRGVATPSSPCPT